MRRACCAIAFFLSAQGIAFGADEDAQPLNLVADTLTYDRQIGIALAEGHVEMQDRDRFLSADSVTYNEKTGAVTASGNVILTQESGEVIFGDHMELEDNMSSGFISEVRAIMADGAKLAARRGEIDGPRSIRLRKAVYSPCAVCTSNPDKPPVWQIRAEELEHNKITHDITYKNASLDVAGYTVAYIPYFSHPDSTVKQRSGVLAPKFGWNSEQGFLLRTYYYHALAPNKDTTFELSWAGNDGPLVGAEYRERFNHGQMHLSGSLTTGDRPNDSNASITEHNRIRGHVSAEGQFDLTKSWRGGFTFTKPTDKTYLRTYDYSDDDVITNKAWAEGFFGRGYLAGNVMTFDDLRPGTIAQQPDVIPMLEASLLGAPGSALGGRMAFDADLVGLSRTRGQDVARMGAIASWERNFTSDLGIATKTSASLRGDVFWINDYDPAEYPAGAPRERFVGRLFPQLHVESSLPLARTDGTASSHLEPVVALTLAPRMGNDARIPNEDSRDAELSVTNLFTPSRFPGSDRIEGGSRVTYGMRAGAYGENGGYSNIFLGQSYRLTNERLFPMGSGIENQRSDIIGQVQIYPSTPFNLDWRFQLDSEDLSSRRHEIAMNAGDEIHSLSASYLYTREVAGTGIGEDRQELSFSTSNQIAPQWTWAFDARTRLGSGGGLLNAGMSFLYKDECFSFLMRGDRDLTTSPGSPGDTSVYFQFGFKNLGEISTPTIDIPTTTASE
ncbi:MAG TPA: LPS-assembly protein LptD [Rhodospirillaceae bacterium]|nr:MAG: hypothetical protein A2018_03580 [Alphaproteobacteria bacterium GWF2_58_20]HAU29649.1 LPS-assembly protein LptD [Rhodospirillaceae bacterium]